MSYKINSPEFAQAWRTVSEALLDYLQQGGSLPLSTSSESAEPAVQANNSTQGDVADGNTASNEVVAPKQRELVAVRYVVTPIKQEDDSYIFKNLKDEQQDSSTFRIKIYSDDSCEFELCEISYEQRQTLKDTMKEKFSAQVCIAEGELTGDCQFLTLKPGKGVFVVNNNNKQIVQILEPLHVEFKSKES